MRVYALLLGILFTTGYGYAAQIAVSSLGAGRPAPAQPAATIPPDGALDGVWYGGGPDPLTVESRTGGTRGAATPGNVLRPPTVRWTEARPAPLPALYSTVLGGPPP